MIYETFGITPIINAAGTNTRLSGGMMHPEVTAAMAEAATACVDMLDLQAAASREIGKHTGAEAALRARRIHLGQGRLREGLLVVNPLALAERDLAPLGQALREVLG
jgi:seryl-tRNA(Sec) selenium transferase